MAEINSKQRRVLNEDNNCKQRNVLKLAEINCKQTKWSILNEQKQMKKTVNKENIIYDWNNWKHRKYSK